MKKILNKKGILGLDTVKAVVIALLTLVVISIAVMLALVSLDNANLFPTGTGANNVSNSGTKGIIGNITTGIGSFYSQVPTFFVLLGVVVLILIISIVIVAVTRFGGGSSGGGSLQGP